jgi:hypothetical protein
VRRAGWLEISVIQKIHDFIADTSVTSKRGEARDAVLGTRALGNGFFRTSRGKRRKSDRTSKEPGAFDIVARFQGHVRGDSANSGTIETLTADYSSQ